jgi:EmrB/QacA subfamily drug resistance transporter
MPLLPSRQLIVPMIVACALFMENLDSTVISTALPAIARSLGEDPLRLNLAITSYLLSLAIFIPASGWMADRFGGRAVFRAAIVVFIGGSICCGLSNSLPEFVAARILQGMGGAMMVPVGRFVMLRTIEKSQLVRTMSYLTTPALLGPVLGPPLGGLIVTYTSWRFIFFINIPIGILGVVLVTLFVDDYREPDPRPLDVPGFVMTGIGLAGVMFGFENAGRGVLPAWLVVAMLTVGAAALALYVWHVRHTQAPIVDLTLLRIPTFFAATVGGSLFRIGIGAMPFLLPLMLQLGFGLTPLASGLLTFASAAGAMTMKMTATPIIRRLGFRPVLVGNAVVSSLFLMVCALFRPTTPHFLILAALLSGGFFRSLQFTATNTLNYADVPAARLSRASSFASMAQQLSISIGVGVGALLVHFTLAWHGGHLSSEDFYPAFVVIGFISMASALLFLRLKADAGEEVSGHHRAAAAATAEPRSLSGGQ